MKSQPISNIMEPMAGAEPATSPLPRVCSTTELHGLPQTLKFLERETGLEPATLCLEGRYSSQLSYSRLGPFSATKNPRTPAESEDHKTLMKNGGQGRIRTFVGVSQQIYSLSPLATRAPVRNWLYRTRNTQLSKFFKKAGAGYGTRTRNLLITNQLLYQLS
jgi:hypothetical protein